ncbi:uncharacterized protein LOC144119292 [Amblyomma americanum]
MNALVFALVFSAALAVSIAGGLTGGYGLGYGGGYGVGYGVSGVGVGSSVALLRGGPTFTKVVAGPAFLVRSVHHVNKLHGGGGIPANSGLGGGYGNLGHGGYGYKKRFIWP